MENKEIKIEPIKEKKIPPVSKQSKALRIKVEPVLATQIADIWRLVEASLVQGKQEYPDTTEEPREKIQFNLFNYMQDPNFVGLLAKIGKRPVGAVLGHVAGRPYGRPSRYAFVWCIWVDPAFRKNGVGQLLWKSYVEKMHSIQVFNWEAHSSELLEGFLKRENGIPVKRLLSVIGGRL